MGLLVVGRKRFPEILSSFDGVWVELLVRVVWSTKSEGCWGKGGSLGL